MRSGSRFATVIKPKTPARRYASAAELADELGRFIEGEPIRARPIGRLERGWRWCRRKPIIAGLGATVLVVALVGFIAVLMQWQRAEFEKRQNRERLTRLHRSNGIQRMEAGDLLGSLSSLVEALRLEQATSASEEIARIRIGSVLQVAPKLRQMWFHKDFVVCAAFSPDAQRILTAGKDGDAIIWDIKSGQALTPVLAAGVPILYAEFSSDGNRVVVTYADQTARVWDVRSGALIGQPLRHNAAGQRQGRMRAIFSPDGQWVLATSDKIVQLWNPQSSVSRYAITNSRSINYADFHPDGRSFAVACSDGKAWVHSAENGEAALEPLLHTRPVEQVKFSPDGRRLVTVCADNTAQIWDATTGRKLVGPLYTSAILPEDINAVDGTASFSPDSRLLITTGTDRTARVWDVETGVAVSQPLAHTHSVVQASFSPDCRFVMTSSHDHSARVWDVASSKLIMVLPHNGFVVCSAFSPGGDQILTAGQDNVAKLWDITGGNPSFGPMEHSRQIECFAFSPDGKFIATGGADQLLHLWNAHTGAKHLTLAHTGTVKTVAFSSDSRLLVSGGGERTAIVWETASGKRLHTFRQVRTVNVACLSPDSRLLLTAGNGGMVQLCEITTGKVIFGDPKVHQETVIWAAFSPNGQMFVTASSDRTAQIRKSSTGELVCPPLIHHAEVRHAVFSPDNRKLLTACADNDPIFYLPCAGQLWDVPSGKKLGPPLQHTDGVLRGAFSPNGKYAATVSEDGSACIWDAASGVLRLQPLKHRFHVLSVEFSRDGRLLLTAGRDGTARLWDVETGEPAMPALVLPAIRARASFSPDGSRFVTSTDQKQAWLWNLAREQRSVEDLAFLSQLLTGQRLDPLSGPVPLDTQRLKALWERYRETAPSLDKPEGTRAWHLLQADYCRFQQHWSAALFHLDRLLLEDPGNTLYLARRAELRAAMKH